MLILLLNFLFFIKFIYFYPHISTNNTQLDCSIVRESKEATTTLAQTNEILLIVAL